MATAAKAPKGKTDTRSLLAEALLDGCDEAEMFQRLLAAGMSESKARYELSRAPKDPLFVAAKRLNARLGKRDWTLGIYGKLAAMDDRQTAIPTVDAIDPEQFFREFYYSNRPVKLTGLIDHWPALERWTLDYLEEKVGDAVVELQGDRDSGEDYEIAKTRHTRHVRMADVIRDLRADEVSNDFYITAYNDTTNKQALSALWSDLGDLPLLAEDGVANGFFWMGPKGTITPFHHDLTNNLLVQIDGRKHIRMVAAHHVAQMRNHEHCFSQWTAEDFDQAETESNTMPAMLECEIGPGEAIFLPVGWWHHVTGLDRTISMSFTGFARGNDFYSDYIKDTAF
ncbi:cupin-like domain-containing protein [Alterisphingorhabdus coralli]|uniref:Cupin-like domain-containing protein n=1 Tax=Alterisphingorhabdus coralli TaxID=3071408 RepID=A0AA97I1W5_9SPHN|nr:cupin-like domain-containing protein [Parasphingorhabdus sp. SCSIO 66989]WOE75735.1 cupin-like domain-containing protein [Parasphingorhabdus sp. SCSIO 66989]